MVNGIIGVVIAFLAMGQIVWGQQKPAAWVVLKVQPQVVFAGGAVNLTCIVTKSDQNRGLRMGVEETRDSEKELDGRSATVHRLQVTNIPCEARVAYCLVKRSDASVVRAEMPLTVAGCE